MDFADLKAAAPNATKDSVIQVKYTAKLNANAAIDDKGNGNKSLVYYQKSTDDGDGEQGETPEDNTWVFTYTLDNSKVDKADSSITLGGAEFVLSRTVDGAKQYAVLDANNKVTSWVTDQAQATTVTTVQGQHFQFKGLDAGKYELIETKAPEGYKLPGRNVPITIVASHQETTSDTGELISVGILQGKKIKKGDLPTATVSQTITNTSASDLPSTGGMGTVAFTVGGLAIMVLAGFGIVARNRKRSEA